MNLRRTGRVASADAAAGLGTIRTDDGEWMFHCTQIIGGARVVPTDATVQFDLRAGLPGSWEAHNIDAVPGSHLCPVCGTPVAGEVSEYEICPCCNWEDDPVQRDDVDAEGANATSLRVARDSWMRAAIQRETGEDQSFARG